MRTAHIDAKYFCLEVNDKGVGVQKKELSKLFFEFQQLDTSTTKKYQETALSLALTQQIVVRSMFGKGSSFFVVLPYQLNDESY